MINFIGFLTNESIVDLYGVIVKPDLPIKSTTIKVVEL